MLAYPRSDFEISPSFASCVRRVETLPRFMSSPRATSPAVLPGCFARNSMMRVLVSPLRTRATARRLLARRAAWPANRARRRLVAVLALVEHLQLLLEPGEPLAQLGLLRFERVNDLSDA